MNQGRVEAIFAIDAQLHSERVDPGTRAQLRHEAPLDELPDGVFVLRDSALAGARLASAELDAGGLRRPQATTARRHALLITPPSLVAVLRAGWQPLVPLLHPSALATGNLT